MLNRLKLQEISVSYKPQPGTLFTRIDLLIYLVVEILFKI